MISILPSVIHEASITQDNSPCILINLLSSLLIPFYGFIIVLFYNNSFLHKHCSPSNHKLPAGDESLSPVPSLMLLFILYDDFWKRYLPALERGEKPPYVSYDCGKK